MRTIFKPNDNPEEVYLTCISRVQDIELKNRLSSIAENIRDSAIEYDQTAAGGSLYVLTEHDSVAGVVSKGEMEAVYTGRMVKKSAPGRAIYDRLKAASPHDICPLCGQRTVSTLDHYLPKANYPSLSVVPVNLIPACGDCNKVKSNNIPKTVGEQTLHPYYDDLTAEQWLYGEVIEEVPVAIKFFIEVPSDMGEVLQARIERHFTTFKLGSLYASQAGTELENIRSRLDGLLKKAGVIAVQEHLGYEAESRHNNHINSWQTAMYQAIASSDWFCNGGFNEA